MNDNLNTIGRQNAERLASMSAVFCAINGLEATEELVRVLTSAILSGVAKWYNDRGRTFNPNTELIEDDAMVEAFTRAQEIAILASVSVSAGIAKDRLNA